MICIIIYTYYMNYINVIMLYRALEVLADLKSVSSLLISVRGWSSNDCIDNVSTLISIHAHRGSLAEMWSGIMLYPKLYWSSLMLYRCLAMKISNTFATGNTPVCCWRFYLSGYIAVHVVQGRHFFKIF